MDKDKVIELAKQAKLPIHWLSETGVLKWSELQAFAKLIRDDYRAELLRGLQTQLRMALKSPWLN